MDIIFQGIHSGDEAVESILTILQLFKERYHINQFSEMHLYLNLLDEQGHNVDLVDSKTSQVYHIFEVYRTYEEIEKNKPYIPPYLELVVDNTHPTVNPKKHS